MKQVVWNDLDQMEQAACLRRPVFAQDESIAEQVRVIREDVRQNGDAAVKKYAQKFDQVDLQDLAALPVNEELDSDICQAIDRAYQNIRTFHEQQGFHEYKVETMSGVNCQRIVRPIENIGLYVPGGTAPLVSTTLMLGVPAQIAGCAQIVLCTPSDKEGNINPYILYAAGLCGIENIFRIGGVQAIAAMAYGTESVPKVDKVLGPGNAYVTQAKMQVAQDQQGAAVDMPAGPSEVCVIADETTNPTFAAADLLSQAEHDVLSQVLLITLSEEKQVKIAEEVQKQLELLPRRDIAAAALENSRSVIANDLDQAIKISNAYAPEHLILCFEGADQYLDQINHAGSIFLGPWTAEAAGDYASGTNHALPTYGYARCYSGLSVEAFQKTMTVQNITQEGLAVLGSTIETLATLEGLDAHARAISVRRAASKG